MSSYLNGSFVTVLKKKTVLRTGVPISTLRSRRMINASVSSKQTAAMFGDDMMGAFLPGLFSAKLASKTLAKFDPTAKNAKYGKIVRTGLAITGGVLTGGLAAGAINSGLQALGASRASVTRTSQQSQVSTPIISPEPESEKKSSVLPILGIGAAAVAALTMM